MRSVQLAFAWSCSGALMTRAAPFVDYEALRGATPASDRADFPKLFELVLRGELRLEEMAGPDHPLEKVNDAFETLAVGRGVRPRIVFDEAP